MFEPSLWHRKYALTVSSNSYLTSLGLDSLKKVEGGGIRIVENRQLCFADTVDWTNSTIADPKFPVILKHNQRNEICSELLTQNNVFKRKKMAGDFCFVPRNISSSHLLSLDFKKIKFEKLIFFLNFENFENFWKKIWIKKKLNWKKFQFFLREKLFTLGFSFQRFFQFECVLR